MPVNQVYFKEQLVEEFAQLKRINSRFSLRAFAAKVGISHGPLSLILRGKRYVSERMVIAISKKLNWSNDVMASILISHLQAPDKNVRPSLDATILRDDEYSLISEWYHYAILSLMLVDGFKSNPTWIAKRLGITENQSKIAIERLIRLKIIRKSSNGTLQIEKRKLRANGDVPSEALKKSHNQGFELASRSLKLHSLDQREFGFLVIPTNATQVKKAKVLIRKMQEDLCELLMDTKKATEVYRFSYQLFPISIPSEEV